MDIKKQEKVFLVLLEQARERERQRATVPAVTNNRETEEVSLERGGQARVRNQ
jgi:hypothetical protein